MKKALLPSFFVLVLLMVQTTVTAQCAVCRATAESATEHVDKGIGDGLNSGILYLMGAPYVLLVVVGIIFFRKKLVALFKS